VLYRGYEGSFFCGRERMSRAYAVEGHAQCPGGRPVAGAGRSGGRVDPFAVNLWPATVLTCADGGCGGALAVRGFKIHLAVWTPGCQTQAAQ